MTDDLAPDLGLRFAKDRKGGTFTFSSVPLSGIVRISPDTYTSMVTLPMEENVAASFDLSQAAFNQLLSLLKPAAAKQLAGFFAGQVQRT